VTDPRSNEELVETLLAGSPRHRRSVEESVYELARRLAEAEADFSSRSEDALKEWARANQAEAEVERLREGISIDLDDPRLDYVTAQIDRDVLHLLRASEGGSDE